MYNTAISALGKARQADAAERLFRQMPAPDAVSYETLIAAYGMSGAADKAEATFEAMQRAGGQPRNARFPALGRLPCLLQPTARLLQALNRASPPRCPPSQASSRATTRTAASLPRTHSRATGAPPSGCRSASGQQVGGRHMARSRLGMHDPGPTCIAWVLWAMSRL